MCCLNHNAYIIKGMANDDPLPNWKAHLESGIRGNMFESWVVHGGSTQPSAFSGNRVDIERDEKAYDGQDRKCYSPHSFFSSGVLGSSLPLLRFGLFLYCASQLSYHTVESDSEPLEVQKDLSHVALFMQATPTQYVLS